MSVRKISGFTIFEMMIVVAITGIATAFAVPEFQDMMARNRVGAAADEMVNALSAARNTAISRRRDVVMTRTGTVWESRLDNATTGIKLGRLETQSPVIATFWQGATVSNDVTQMTFEPSGLVKKTSGGTESLSLTIRYCDSGSRRETGKDITVSRIGRIVAKKHSSLSTCNP
ncbi:MAG: GspH/FimT family pseudopilin [Pseudomonadota bacterium]